MRYLQMSSQLSKHHLLNNLFFLKCHIYNVINFDIYFWTTYSCSIIHLHIIKSMTHCLDYSFIIHFNICWSSPLVLLLFFHGYFCHLTFQINFKINFRSRKKYQCIFWYWVSHLREQYVSPLFHLYFLLQ